MMLRTGSKIFAACVRRDGAPKPIFRARHAYSTAPGATNSASLPLAGIRVLDMTRVLAGVGDSTEACDLIVSTVADNS